MNSKFKPIGAEANKENTNEQVSRVVASSKSDEHNAKYSLRTDEVDEEEAEAETGTEQPPSDLSNAQSATSVNSSNQSGIAAAGFKKFVKKSISIRIKTNESGAGGTGEPENSITAETRLLKENKHISKKRSTKFIDIKRPDSEDVSNELSSLLELENSGKQQWQSQADKQPPSSLSESEKLRAQLNQYNSNNPMQQQQHYNQRYQPQQQQQHPQQQQQQIIGYIPAPPISFAIPPPPLGPRLVQPHLNEMNHPQQHGHHPHHMQQPHSYNSSHPHHQPPHHGNYIHMMPPNVHYQQNQAVNPYMSHPYQQANLMQHQQQQQMMQMQQVGNMIGNDGKYGKSAYDDDYDVSIDNVNVNDDAAYDLSDEDLLSDEPGDSKNLSTVDYDYNYDLELDNINDIIKVSSSSKKHRKHHHHHKHSDEEYRVPKKHSRAARSTKRKQKSGKLKRKHSSEQESHEGSFDEEEVAAAAQVEPDEQDLTAIKEMLVSILKMHVENDEEYDEELRATLESLLAQVTEDDMGLLTFEELSQIHLTIKTLLEGGDSHEPQEEESNESISDLEDGRGKKKKRKLTDTQESRSMSQNDNLKSSKKKRKHSNEGNVRDSKHGKKSRSHHNENSSFEVENTNGNLTEVEAGEIDDVYDDEFIVEKEFEDLLMNSNGNKNVYASKNIR